MHLLPAIDILGGKVVRLSKGDYDKVTIYHDDPVEQAHAFERAGATWVHVVDLDGARDGTSENLTLIDEIIAGTHLSVEVGGGIRSIEAIERLVSLGVSRVVLGTSLVRDPEFASLAIKRFGGLLAAGIDARDGEAKVAGWKDGSGISAEDLVAQVARSGFEHLIYTDIARDGMQTGVDNATYERIAGIFGNPVVVSGGIATLDDIERLESIASMIEGVIVGRAVYEGSFDVARGVAACTKATQAVSP